MADGTTDRYEVVAHRLLEATGETLAGWLKGQRDAKASWQTIAFALWQHTAVQVNPETLRRWYTRQVSAQEGEDRAPAPEGRSDAA